MPVKVFLNYAHDDKAVVQMLYTNLLAAGFEPWMDKHAISGGERWRLRIDEGLRQADFIVVCLSPRSVTKEGVLQEEIATALELWRKRGGSEAFIIPARLEECDVPATLQQVQWVDIFQPEQWTVVADAIRKALRLRKRKRIQRISAVCGALLLVVLGWFAWSRSRARAQFLEEFHRLRGVAENSGQAYLGATIWKVSPDVWCQDANPPKPADRARVRSNTTFAEGDKVRIGIEPGQAGYVYVIDQPEYDGVVQAPKLIFPSTKIRNGENRFDRAGRLLELPAMNSPPWCWTLERPEARKKSGNRLTAEWLTIVTSAAPIAELSLPADDLKVAHFLSTVETQAQVSVHDPDGAGQPATQAEIDSAEGRKELTIDDPPPQTIYSSAASPGRPIAVRLPLRLR